MFVENGLIFILVQNARKYLRTTTYEMAFLFFFILNNYLQNKKKSVCTLDPKNKQFT